MLEHSNYAHAREGFHDLFQSRISTIAIVSARSLTSHNATDCASCSLQDQDVAYEHSLI